MPSCLDICTKSVGTVMQSVKLQLILGSFSFIIPKSASFRRTLSRMHRLYSSIFHERMKMANPSTSAFGITHSTSSWWSTVRLLQAARGLEVPDMRDSPVILHQQECRGRRLRSVPAVWPRRKLIDWRPEKCFDLWLPPLSLHPLSFWLLSSIRYSFLLFC